MRQGIAAAGNWIVDRVKVVDHWPEQDTLADILDETVGNGGGAFNILVDLSKLGARFALEGVGLVGDDAEGDWILEKCRKNGIQSEQIGRIDVRTSYTDVITAKDTGRRTFFHQRGANARFGPESINVSGLDSQIFYLGYALLLDTMDSPDEAFGTGAAKTLEMASREDMKTALDVVSEDSDRFGKIVNASLPFVDWCFMNEFEAGRTVGLSLRCDEILDRDKMEEAAQALLRAGVRETVFLHAPEGALASSKNGKTIWQPSIALPSTEVAGSVGAGDAFAAGVLLGLHEKEPLQECLIKGVCAAAASLRHPSASEGLMPMEDCLALAGAHGLKN